MCGNTSNIIGGKVTKITPVIEPSNQIFVVSTCKSCKAKYVFQDGTISGNEVEIILSRSVEIKSFYCYLGGGDTKYVNKILEYNNESVFSYISDESVKLPYITNCTNPLCHLTYKFSELS